MLCELCPRECKVNRKSGIVGYCGETDTVRIARAALHNWEEPCISGYGDNFDAAIGSGAIFFTGCNMRCIFCQNHDISGSKVGMEVSIPRLAEIMLELEARGACNINLVTPSHFVPQIASAIRIARDGGLTLPIVYNTSAYEKVDTIRRLDGLIDIYLPDFKYMDDTLAMKFSGACEYSTIATAAIDEMVRQIRKRAGRPIMMEATSSETIDDMASAKAADTRADTLCGFDERGVMTRGVIVRHMIMPGHTKDSIDVIRHVYERYGEDVYISIMNQYTPLSHVMESEYEELRRKVTKREYNKVVDFATELGIVNGFIQEGKTQSESFIPAFDYTGVL